MNSPSANGLITVTVPLEKEVEQAHRQAVNYGKDLARLFVVEQSRRHELEILNHTLETVLESVPQGLIVTDHQFVIKRYNPAFQQLLQADQTDCVGKALGDLFPEGRFGESLNWLMNNPPCSARTEFHSGKNLAINAFFAPLPGSQDWIVLFTDQSYTRRIEQQKTDFVNLIAHEIRTPLTIILGYTELIREDVNNATNIGEIRQRLEPVYESGRQLQKIVDELLHFAQVTRGSYHPDQLTDVDVEQLVQDILKGFRNYADERLILTQVFIPEKIPPIQTNPAVLTTALTHLMLNGLEVTPAGGILRVEVLKEGTELLIRISDTGSDIPFDKRESVFELGSYVLLLTDKKSDLRLGLPIAKHAVDRLGGVLTLETYGGKATVFQIRLPYQQNNIPGVVQQLQAELGAKHQQSMAYANDLKQLYSRLQQTNRELKTTNAQLEESNQVKSNFLGLVSHELKTPVSSLETSIYLFKKMGTQNLSDDQQEMLEQISMNHQRTKELVEQLVKYAGLLSKQGKLILQPINVSSLIERTFQTAFPMAESRGISLETAVSPALSLTGDKRLIEEALWQLVHNAIKATKPGGRIIIRGYDADGFISFEVQDNGCGIPTEKQRSIWESFTQTTDYLKRGMEGLGLGLALVRYVAQAHKGQVTLQSEPETGSVIGFWIPTFQPTSESGS